MENIIARMISDFEAGRMNRRQLIKNLAMVSAVAGGAGTAVAASPMKAVALNHISYQVADYKRTRDWYSELLGMQVSHDDGKQCYLTFGAGSWLLARNARDTAAAPKVDHIAYTLESWDMNAVEAELKKHGLTPRKDTENSFHVKDPDGFDVQISGKEMKP